jgi:hypothetical protein
MSPRTTHLLSATATVATIATLKHVNADRFDLMFLVGFLLGVVVAVLTRWWSMAYAALLIGGMIGLATFDAEPFQGEYGFISGLILTAVAVGAAVLAACIVNVCRFIF